MVLQSRTRCRLRSCSGHHLLGVGDEFEAVSKEFLCLSKLARSAEGEQDFPRDSRRQCRLAMILKKKIKSMGNMEGKSEENWANFSIKMGGKKSSAVVSCQAFRQGDAWRFTVVSLDTPQGRVYLCK